MGVLQELKDKILGTEEQNKAAEERQKAAAEKYPDSAEAKVEKAKKAVGMKKGGTASARADGCAQRGKTKGRMV